MADGSGLSEGNVHNGREDRIVDASKRYLIVNADDFGLSPGVNRGVIEAYEEGIVTSASLMVRPPAAREAAAYAREHSSLSVGLHLDLGEWVYDEGAWSSAYEVIPTDDEAAVREEAARQFALFRRLVGRDPTHVDSHQHVHLREPARSILIELCRKLEVPLRHHSERIRYCGDFYGQTGEGQPLPGAISAESLIGILVDLQPGTTELACHPGVSEPELESTYRSERAEELGALCDPRVRATIIAERIELRSFADPAP